MREIKFRAWIKNKKLGNEIFRVIMISWIGNEVILSGRGGSVELKDCELMQFTSLKDKRGREIWEGDILSIGTEDRHKINVVCEYGIARRKMDTGVEVDIPSFYFRRVGFDNLYSYPIVKNYRGKHDLEIMEVIGNIYSNPELLKHDKSNR